MKYILTNVDIPQEGIDEVESLLGWDLTVEKTTATVRPKWNPFHRAIWGDFDYHRSLFPNDSYVRCFVTSLAELRRVNITSHIGMYDAVHRDRVHDFYFGLPVRLDRRAKANGFKTNFAWLFIHELLHGKEKNANQPDRVHTMEAQGRLKELLELHHDLYEGPNKPEVVITHHALSGPTHTVQDLNKWHKERWPNFISRKKYHAGYHYVIEKDGTITQTRYHDEEGAHTLGMNSRSIGVCFMGNFDKEMPTKRQTDAWVTLYNKLLAQYPDIPTAPHRAFSDRTCHGTKLADNHFQLFHKRHGLLLQLKRLLIRQLSILTNKLWTN